MAIFDFLDKPFFDPRYKLAVHLLQGVLITVAVGLSVPKIFAKNQPRTRAGTIALAMGAKSLVLLAYMLATEYVHKLKKWHSYKANVIISCLEVVFWGAVAFLVMQANLKQCAGIYCTLSWIVVGVAVVVNILENYTAMVSIREFREYRKSRNATRISGSSSGDWRHRSDEEEMVQHAVPKEAHTPPSKKRESSRPHRHHQQQQGAWTASELPPHGRHSNPPVYSQQQQYQAYSPNQQQFPQTQLYSPLQHQQQYGRR